MAKMKTFAVEVEIAVYVTLFVDARRPNGAAAKVMTEDGWNYAARYLDEVDLTSRRTDAVVIKVREVG